MPIRIASLTHRLARNGAMLHQAMMDRVQALGADHAPSAAELALIDERRALKDERAKRQVQAQQPKPTAVEKLVRTHHPVGKDKPKAKKDHSEAKAGGKKHGPTRAEKHAAKAAAKQAATRAPKKPAAKG